MRDEYDILIVGGGLVGGSLALALKDLPLRIGLIEALAPPDRQKSKAGDRALALSRNTVQLLERLNLWGLIQPHAMAIRHIHVSDRGHFGKARLHASDQHIDSLGHIVLARTVEAAIQKKLDESSITQISPASVIGLKPGINNVSASLMSGDKVNELETRLIVAADGGNSSIRQLLHIKQHIRDYGQTALVFEVNTEKDTNFTAYERFTSNGPLAFLPVDHHKASVVWTVDNRDADALLAQSESQFNACIQDAFGYWLGKISRVSEPQGFPLRLIRAERMIGNQSILIGNAMHQIHPVAGQGFNLGLRDAVTLADRIGVRVQMGREWSDNGFLGEYEKSRKEDLLRVVRYTDSLVRIFSMDLPPVAAARNLALFSLDRFVLAKRLLSHYAMGYGSGQ